MILNTKTGELTEGRIFKKTYWLTKNQKKLLMLLSDNQMHSSKEICDYMGWNDSRTISLNVLNIERKVKGFLTGKKISIKNKYGVGYILEDIIELTY